MYGHVGVSQRVQQDAGRRTQGVGTRVGTTDLCSFFPPSWLLLPPPRLPSSLLPELTFKVPYTLDACPNPYASRSVSWDGQKYSIPRLPRCTLVHDMQQPHPLKTRQISPPVSVPVRR